MCFFGGRNDGLTDFCNTTPPQAIIGFSACKCPLTCMSRRPERTMWVCPPQTPRCANRFQPARSQLSERAPHVRPCLVCRCAFLFVCLFVCSTPTHLLPSRPALFPSAARNGAPAPLAPSTFFNGLHKDAAALVLIRERPPVAGKGNRIGFRVCPVHRCPFRIQNFQLSADVLYGCNNVAWKNLQFSCILAFYFSTVDF